MFIVKRKQVIITALVVIITALVVMIAAAGYFNYIGSQPVEPSEVVLNDESDLMDIAVFDENSEIAVNEEDFANAEEMNADIDEEAPAGDAVFVNSSNKSEFDSNEFKKIAGNWEITEYLGTFRQSHIYPMPEGYYPSKDEIDEHNKKFLNKTINIEPSKIKYFRAPSELGYYYDSLELFDIYWIPSEVISAFSYTPSPEGNDIMYATFGHNDFTNEVHFLFIDEDNAFIGIDTFFYKVQRNDYIKQ